LERAEKSASYLTKLLKRVSSICVTQGNAELYEDDDLYIPKYFQSGKSLITSRNNPKPFLFNFGQK